jgi:hypothetical protein
MVSLTITEKGYFQRVDGNLDVDDPNVKSDLADLSRPRTAIGEPSPRETLEIVSVLGELGGFGLVAGSLPWPPVEPLGLAVVCGVCGTEAWVCCGL